MANSKRKYDYSSFIEVKRIIQREGTSSKYLSSTLKDLYKHFPEIANCYGNDITNKGYLAAKAHDRLGPNICSIDGNEEVSGCNIYGTVEIKKRDLALGSITFKTEKHKVEAS